uniref:Efflux RND transporter periplasmic adaptor subunit n=1 Tax=Candidatus Desulfatibia profunda TaxID=2841695 RepID=A0A8J6TKN8_9BACT|nr:efflux RND transporter periplasmic adaptor subunit [Candidatus Desulfatibia profunda]
MERFNSENSTTPKILGLIKRFKEAGVKKRLILAIFIVLLLGVGILVYVGQWLTRTGELYYSGTIEATQANLAFQVSGRVSRILTDEGRAVTKEQILAEIDAEEFLAQRNQAYANLTLAQETLKELEAFLSLYQDTLPAEVEKAAAVVKVLEARRDEQEAGYRTQEVEQARLAFLAAEITKEEARKDKVRFDTLFQRGTIAEKEKDAVNLRYETALKDYERAREAYDLLRQGFRTESIEAARARLAEGRAGFKQARAYLKKIEAAARQVEAARARVQAASAALELAEIQLRHTRLKAPFAGIITSRNVEPGEVVAPAREVISLADLSTVDLKLFVAETEIGKVKPGQKVEVKTDTFPNKVYTGHVAFISPEGEFTPKIIQTHKERVKLVYLVKITVPNPNLELKTGMPADAWFR